MYELVDLIGVGPFCVISGIVLVGLLVTFLWKKSPQDKAIVITGLKKRVLCGKGGIVIPFLEQTNRISLENMNIDVNTNDSLSSTGVPIDCDGVAIIKIKSTDESILLAMEQFNTGNEKDTINNIKCSIREVLEGKLREIVSKMSVEEIYKDREDFANKVEEVAKNDLEKMGLEIKTFTIREIKDQNKYLEALGARKIAEVKKDAAIAIAEAAKEEQEKISQFNRLGKEAQLKAETEIAEATKVKEVQIQAFLEDQARAKAKADFAYEVEQNIIKKEVIETQKNAELLAERRQTEIAQQQAFKKEKELEGSIKKMAEAEKYRLEQESKANRFKFEEEAAAKARAIELEGQAKAKAIELEGQARAKALIAEAEAIEKRAKVYKELGQAVIIEELAKNLPEIAKNIALPLSQIDNMTVIDNGGEGGASKVTKNVTEIMSQLPTITKNLTGIDITSAISTFINGTNTDLTEE